jgi:hypothetical protein
VATVDDRTIWQRMDNTEMMPKGTQWFLSRWLFGLGVGDLANGELS